MAFTSVLDWFCALKVHSSNSKKSALFWLWLSIGSNVAMLFLFKYFHYCFGKTTIPHIMSNNNITAWIVELGKYTIPAGISFYTFQSLSYIIDVYRKTETPEKNPFKFMLFVSFFPQLVAGPIERFGKLHGQLFSAYLPIWEDVKNGLRLALYGLFLKLCVADNLAAIVDVFYSDPIKYDVSSSWISVLAFAFQVYSDFFAYSLLAQGSALLFGIHLMDNFNKPYIAKSIPEFWHRWHISLSTWFKDYIFIPIGGNKKGPFVLALAVLLVFFTSGLWHGAATTMILFGLCQGLLYLFDRFIFSKINIKNRFWNYFKQWKTFMFFTLSLLFFRAQHNGQPIVVWKNLWGLGTGNETLAIEYYIVLFTIIFWICDNFLINNRFDLWINEKSKAIRWSIYGILLACIFMFGGATNHPFVYFQF